MMAASPARVPDGQFTVKLAALAAWMPVPRTVGAATATPPTLEITPAAEVIVVLSTSTTPNAEDDAFATVIAPPVTVIIVPSGLTSPNAEEVAFCTGGAPSERRNVVAVPLTTVSLAVAVGFAPTAPGGPDPGPSTFPVATRWSPRSLMGMSCASPGPWLDARPITWAGRTGLRMPRILMSGMLTGAS